MNNLKPPKPLSLEGAIAENWRTFKRSWDVYYLASGISEKSNPVKVACFLHVIGTEALEIHNTFVIPEADENDIKKLIDKFENYCLPKVNVTYERYIFRNIMQNNRQFDNFLVELKTKVKTCDYQQLTESLIRDQIVIGTDSKTLRERLLREANLTLEKAENICRTAEICKAQTLQFNAPEVHNIRSKRSSKSDSRGHRQSKSKNVQSTKFSKCRNCGYTHEPKQCPAFGKTCYACNLKNHFGSVCRNKKQVNECSNDKLESSDSSDNESDDPFALYAISSDKHVNEIFSYVNIDEKSIKMKIDSGSSVNVLPKKMFDKVIGKTILLPNDNTLISYGGKKLPILGKCNLKIGVNGKSINAVFYIVDLKSKPLLGLSSSLELNLIKIDKTVEVAGVINAPKSSYDSILEEYEDIFKGLGCVKGTYKINMDPNVKPRIAPQRKVPLSILPRLKAKLDELIEQGVVSKVEEPTEWVSSLVIVEKKNGSLRLCLDPPYLNEAIIRDIHKPPSREMVSSALSGCKVFSIVDLSNCFWQKELTPESAKLCTFNTPFGRMCFNRMPFGICSASDVSQKMVDDIFSGIPNTIAIHDDIIIGGRDHKEHDQNIRNVFERARASGAKFNRKKIQFRIPEVKFMGEIVSENGFAPDPDRISAIKRMRNPTNVKELQEFLGIINFLSKYIPNMSKVTAPLRDLLKKGNQWLWNHEHEVAIAILKGSVCDEPVLRFFDVNKSIVIECDASMDGLGACLIQDEHPVCFASRVCTPSERNYSPIERELLSMVFACERFHTYVYGLPLIIHNDHKPLETILKQPLSLAPPRLQSLYIRVLPYNPEIKWVPGRFVKISDAMSRAPLDYEPDTKSNDFDTSMRIMIHNIERDLNITEEKLAELKMLNESDNILCEIRKYVYNSWPNNKASLPSYLHAFWHVRNEIFDLNGILMKGEQMIIPKLWIKDTLSKLHLGHFGVEKTKNRARQCIYWPGMSKDIEDLILSCEICLANRCNNQKEPMLRHQIPSRPYEFIATDIFEYDSSSYLVVIDYYSKYIDCVKIRNKNAHDVIRCLKHIFAMHGIPFKVLADNNPFNSLEFHKFAKEYQFEIVHSSPHYHQSNGLAEKAVGICKKWLKKGLNLDECLLEYRNTPVAKLPYAPSQLLMGRLCRTRVLTHPKNLNPRIIDNVPDLLKLNQDKQKTQYDKSASSKPLPPLYEGQSVRVKSNPRDRYWKPATVIETADYRKYVVKTEEGTQLTRNRKDLIKPKTPPETPEIEIDPNDDPSNCPDTDNDSKDNNNNIKGSPDEQPVRRSNRKCKRPDYFVAS